MKKTALKFPRLSKVLVLPAILLFSFVVVSVIFADPLDDVETTLEQLISEAAISIDIVDATGASVATPSVSFSEFFFSFEPADSTGVLGTDSQRIRLSNPTETEQWSISIAATGGVEATWSDGGTDSYPYNDATSADNGRLTVDAAANGVITPGNTCSTDNITRGASATFEAGETDAVTILTAGEGTENLCFWDLTNVELTQRIPEAQAPGTYSIDMTLTAL